MITVMDTLRTDFLLLEKTDPQERPVRHLLEQWRHGLTWTAFGGEKILAIFGLFNRPDNALEAWFQCTPHAAAYMLPLTRRMRTLLRIRQSRMRPTLCTVQPGHTPGERLARLLGFRPTGEFFDAPGTPVHGVQFWRYETWEA